MLRAGPGNDIVDGGTGSPDDCDGEAGTDVVLRCELASDLP